MVEIDNMRFFCPTELLRYIMLLAADRQSVVGEKLTAPIIDDACVQYGGRVEQKARCCGRERKRKKDFDF